MIAAEIHILLHVLAPLDTRESLEQPSLAAPSAATARTAYSVPGQKDETTEARDCSASDLGDIDADSQQEREIQRQQSVRQEESRRQSDVRPGMLCEQPHRSPDAGDSPEGCSPRHIDGGEPRTGINLVPVFGELVQAIVTYHGWSRTNHYLATEVEYDLGRPSCHAHTPLQALRDLQSLLEDEHIRDARRRDAEFANTLARTEI